MRLPLQAAKKIFKVPGGNMKKANDITRFFSRPVTALLLAACFGFAADKAAPAGKHGESMEGMGGGMPMMDMMGDTKGECMATSDSLSKVLAAVQEARKSDDKAKMKAALEMVEGRIAGMQGHMGECKANMGHCMEMMKMMGGMMGGGMMGQGMQGMDKKSGNEKMEPSEHEKHHPK
jgi:hypothetical protein